MLYFGELAALGTAITGAISITIFTLASMRIGSFSMSHYRLLFGLILLLLLNKIIEGPSFGVWLSILAVKHAPIGVAMIIISLMPVTILPIAAIVYREEIIFNMHHPHHHHLSQFDQDYKSEGRFMSSLAP